MSTFFELDSDGWAQRVADAQMRPDALDIAEPGFTEGALKGQASGVMLGGAKAADFLGTMGRFFSPPAATDEEEAVRQQTLEDADEIQEDLRRSAIDYWTPNAKTVGTLGKVLGGVSEMVLPLAATAGQPELLIGSQTLASGKELVDKGVDADTAGAMAAVEGATTYAGFKLPFLGKTLTSKMATGAAGNLGLGAGAAELEHQILAARDYKELAENYDPLDATSRAVDLVTGLAFGGTAHLIDGRMKPSQRDAALGANNAKHWQQDTAPGIPMNDAATAWHGRNMESAFDRISNDEPASAEPMPPDAVFKPRPERKIEVPEELREFEANRAAERAFVEGRNADERTRIDELVPRADIAGVKDENLRKSLGSTYERAARVKDRFDQNVRAIAADIGSPHEPLIPKTLKGVERASEKAVADYGGDVSKVKDLVRATVVVDNVEQAQHAVAEAVKKFGTPTKLRNGFDPKFDSADGYRDINMNFDVGGQTVELQVNLPEMLKAKETGHKLYEERRTLDAKADRSAAEDARMAHLDSQMSKAYAAAWNEALSRSNSASEISSPSSRGNRSETGLPPGTSQARTIEPPSAVRTMETGTPSQLKNLGKLERKAATGAILPEGGVEAPVISAVKELLTQRDIEVPTGAFDAEGNPVVRSGREVMAEHDAAIAKAENDAKGFAAAISCFLTRGIDDAS